MESLAESNEGLPGSVAWLTEHHSGSFDTLRSVGDILQTDEEKAAALEAALGDSIHFLVVDTMDDAVRASALLKENKKGRATFIPLDELRNSYPVADESIYAHISTEADLTQLLSFLRDL